MNHRTLLFVLTLAGLNPAPQAAAKKYVPPQTVQFPAAPWDDEAWMHPATTKQTLRLKTSEQETVGRAKRPRAKKKKARPAGSAGSASPLSLKVRF